MIRSMTGYGRFEGTVGGRNTVFEIRSVNQRFFEFQCKVPKGMGFLEQSIKEQVSKYVARGKVDVFFSVEADENVAAEIKVNHAVASGYMAAIKELCDTYGLKNDTGVTAFSRFADVLSVNKAPENEEQLKAIVSESAEKALADFMAMREREGEKLKNDVLEHSRNILSLVEYVEERSPKIVAEYREKLYARLMELLEDKMADSQRILTEAAIFADKTSVAEETVRLRSHLSQLEDMLTLTEPVGRKLDFIVQEMSREANTIGSKICDADIAHKVVDIKSEIEKIREQIQNIE